LSNKYGEVLFFLSLHRANGEVLFERGY